MMVRIDVGVRLEERVRVGVDLLYLSSTPRSRYLGNAVDSPMVALQEKRSELLRHKWVSKFSSSILLAIVVLQIFSREPN